MLSVFGVSVMLMMCSIFTELCPFFSSVSSIVRVIGYSKIVSAGL